MNAPEAIDWKQFGSTKENASLEVIDLEALRIALEDGKFVGSDRVLANRVYRDLSEGLEIEESDRLALQKAMMNARTYEQGTTVEWLLDHIDQLDSEERSERGQRFLQEGLARFVNDLARHEDFSSSVASKMTSQLRSFVHYNKEADPSRIFGEGNEATSRLFCALLGDTERTGNAGAHLTEALQAGVAERFPQTVAWIGGALHAQDTIAIQTSMPNGDEEGQAYIADALDPFISMEVADVSRVPLDAEAYHQLLGEYRNQLQEIVGEQLLATAVEENKWPQWIHSLREYSFLSIPENASLRQVDRLINQVSLEMFREARQYDRLMGEKVALEKQGEQLEKKWTRLLKGTERKDIAARLAEIEGQMSTLSETGLLKHEQEIIGLVEGMGALNDALEKDELPDLKDSLKGRGLLESAEALGGIPMKQYPAGAIVVARRMLAALSSELAPRQGVPA